MEMPLPEMPALAVLHCRCEARGLATLTVPMRLDPPAAVAGFAARRGLPFGCVIDNTGAFVRVFPGPQATPTTHVIDKRGTVARRHAGEPDFPARRALVETLLTESSATA